MAEAGILHEDDRIELIEGELIEMAAIGTKNFTCVNMLNRFLVRSVGDQAIVSVRNPARLDEKLEPQPDVAVPRAKDYSDALPGPEDVLLLIGVSDTTLTYDRETKLPSMPARGCGKPGSWTFKITRWSVIRNRPGAVTGSSGVPVKENRFLPKRYRRSFCDSMTLSASGRPPRGLPSSKG